MSGKTESGTQVIRYAKTMVLQTTIQSGDPTRIHPPKLIIDYADEPVASWDATGGKSATDVVFKVEYTMKTDRFWTAVKIMIGFVGAVGVVVWIIRVNNRQSRNRRSSRDGNGDTLLGAAFLLHAAMIGCNTFVQVFFPLTASISAYWFICFKLQDEVFVMLPQDSEFYGLANEYVFFDILFHSLFWMQTVYMIYIVIIQSSVDIFLVDWEKPKGRYSEVSMWRSVMVSNEWKRMQAQRKTSIEFSLLWIGFLTVGLGVSNNARAQPGLGYDPADGYITNPVLRFANTVFLFMAVSIIQRVWKFMIWERYCTEPAGQRFIDLATVAKISVFLLDEDQHGYYLHCRSPHEYADCGTEELIRQMEKEAHGFTTDRGLDIPGCPQGAQAFELFASSVFRRQINKILSSLAGESGRHSRSEEDGRLTISTSERAKSELQAFLKSWVDQSPPPQRDGLRRVVREKFLVERVLAIPPADVRAGNSKCVLYPDQTTWVRDHAYLGTTFLGTEFDLLVHDILTFNIVDMAFDSPTTSILLTYLMHLLRGFVRSRLGKANIVRKSFLLEGLL